MPVDDDTQPDSSLSPVHSEGEQNNELTQLEDSNIDEQPSEIEFRLDEQPFDEQPSEIEDRLKEQREDTRDWLAKGLLCSLIGSYITSLIIIGVPQLRPQDEEQSIKDYLTLIITSQTTLVGTALGFYFGSKSE